LIVVQVKNKLRLKIANSLISKGAANITEVVAVLVWADQIILDQADYFVNGESHELCRHIINVQAETIWSVQCLKKRNF